MGRGEALEILVTLPREDTLPPGFVYVPEGRSLYGSIDVEVIRSFFSSEPARVVRSGPYLIGRNELTNGEFIAFLAALSPADRAARLTPEVAHWESGHGISMRPDGTWQFELKLGEKIQTAGVGNTVRLHGGVSVDWTQLPVAGMSWPEAEAYPPVSAMLSPRPRGQAINQQGARTCNEP